MLKPTYHESSVSKKRERRLFFIFITFCLIILCTGEQVLPAKNDLTKVRINLINFLYIIDGGYSRQNGGSQEIERTLLFPGIEKTLSAYEISNYGIQYDKVSSGRIEYNSGDFEAVESGLQQNQLTIWGMVKPVNWPESYNLDLQYYYNSHPIIQFRLEIRKNTIVSWNNQKCRLPITHIALVGGSLAFKIAGPLNGDKAALSNEDINRRISEQLKDAGDDLPDQIKSFLLSWQAGDQTTETGSEANLTLLLDRGSSHKLNLDQNAQASIQRFLTTNRTMNWYLEQGSVLMPEITFSTERAGAAELATAATALSRPTQLAVGVMPFSNRSNQSDWLGFGMEYLLTNKFSQISAYKLADREIVKKFISTDSATVVVNGQNWSLDYTMGGNYSHDGDGLEVDLSIFQAFGGIRIASERYSRRYDDFFEVVDQAADKFLTLTDITVSEEEHQRFHRRVTNSMTAFEYFCMGYIENSKPVKNEDKIIRYFKEAISHDAEFWGAYYNLGTVYYNQEAYQPALIQFNTIIDRFPSFELAYLGRGLTYLRQNKNQQALADLQKYQIERPEDFRAYYYLGRCHIALRQFNEAINHLNKAAELYPAHARTFFELGNAYYATNRFRRAIYFYNQTIRLDPDYLETHKRLGESYYRMHNFNGAIDEFKLVLTSRPTDPESNFMLGITVYKQALLDEYIDAFLEMYGLLKEEEIAANQQKHNGEKDRIYKEMVRRFQLAQSYRNNFYEATFNLALTYQEMGQPDSALFYYQKTLRLNPKLGKARIVLARFYEGQSDYDRALEQYKQAVRIDPAYFIDYPRLGEAFDEIDVLATVVDELETEIRGDPHDIEASLSLANIYFAQGYQGKAAVLYRKILSIQPQQATAQQMLARIGS